MDRKVKCVKTKQKTPLQSHQGRKMTVHCKKLHNVLRKLSENVKLNWGWVGGGYKSGGAREFTSQAVLTEWIFIFFFFPPV